MASLSSGATLVRSVAVDPVRRHAWTSAHATVEYGVEIDQLWSPKIVGELAQVVGERAGVPLVQGLLVIVGF